MIKDEHYSHNYIDFFIEIKKSLSELNNFLATQTNESIVEICVLLQEHVELVFIEIDNLFN